MAGLIQKELGFKIKVIMLQQTVFAFCANFTFTNVTEASVSRFSGN